MHGSPFQQIGLSADEGFNWIVTVMIFLLDQGPDRNMAGFQLDEMSMGKQKYIGIFQSGHWSQFLSSITSRTKIIDTRIVFYPMLRLRLVNPEILKNRKCCNF